MKIIPLFLFISLVTSQSNNIASALTTLFNGNTNPPSNSFYTQQPSSNSQITNTIANQLASGSFYPNTNSYSNQYLTPPPNNPTGSSTFYPSNQGSSTN